MVVLISRLPIAAAPMSRLAIDVCSKAISCQPQGMPTTASFCMQSGLKKQAPELPRGACGDYVSTGVKVRTLVRQALDGMGNG